MTTKLITKIAYTHTQSDEYDLHPVEFLEKKKHYAN